MFNRHQNTVSRICYRFYKCKIFIIIHNTHINYLWISREGGEREGNTTIRGSWGEQEGSTSVRWARTWKKYEGNTSVRWTRARDDHEVIVRWMNTSVRGARKEHENITTTTYKKHDDYKDNNTKKMHLDRSSGPWRDTQVVVWDPCDWIWSLWCRIPLLLHTSSPHSLPWSACLT